MPYWRRLLPIHASPCGGGDNGMRVARTLATSYGTCDRLVKERILQR